jgi:hypothetical protein
MIIGVMLAIAMSYSGPTTQVGFTVLPATLTVTMPPIAELTHSVTISVC